MPSQPAPTTTSPRPLLVLGTRPEAIKLAPVAVELRRRGVPVRVCVTGQQRHLVQQACNAVGLTPDVTLDLMRPDQSPTEFLGRCLGALDELLRDGGTDTVIVQGDTTSALAGALAAHYRRHRLLHVEAGLRTHDLTQPFPEEGHRQLIARLADLHLCPTPQDADALRAEGIAPGRILVCGNTVVDACLPTLPLPTVTNTVIVTTHRRENFDGPLEQILGAVRDLAEMHPGMRFVLPVHPNPKVQPVVQRLLGRQPNVQLREPMPYDEFLRELAACRFVITDSGGVQEEAPMLGKPVVVVRGVTERPLGVHAGAAFLVGAGRTQIVALCRELLHDGPRYRHAALPRPLYGDGQASRRIAQALLGEPVDEFKPPL